MYLVVILFVYSSGGVLAAISVMFGEGCGAPETLIVHQ